MRTLSRWTTHWLLIGLLAAPLSASAATFDDPRLPDVRDALQSAEQGRLDPRSMRTLADHPLASWIEYAQLKHDLATASPEQVRAYLNRYLGQPATRLLRDAWLQQLDHRQDWPNFRAFYAGSDKPTLQCADLAARLATGAVDAAWDTDAIALWSSSGGSLSGDCDAPFTALANRGKLTSDLRWKRIELAADAGNGAVMRVAAHGLPATDFTQANSYASFIDSPTMSAAAWPKTERSRRIAADGLERMARRNPGGAESLLSGIASALQLNAAQRGQVLYDVALWTVASYLPGSAQRLAAVPKSAYDERLHEWHVREAMARGDDAMALKAIAAMDTPQRNDPRWQYFAARMRERGGDAPGAKALYMQAARTATFHGFLAADRLNIPYTICAREVQPSRADSARIAANPALLRAIDLFRIDRISWALIEWKQAITGMGDNERQIAVSLAQDAGWFDRALFSLGKHADGSPAPDELRLYTLRFPLNHARNVQDEAQRNGIDRAWVAAEIRAESGWMPNARSSADARGLMQLLPSTGVKMARALGVAWTGNDTLFQPLTNITLGTAYLRQMLDRFDGKTYLAIGAYNAGSAPVQRWLAQRPTFDPDFWIETVSYKETREYIARVLAFSVIYDWRFDGRATPLSDRMLGRITPATQRRGFACPANTDASTADDPGAGGTQ